MLLSFDPSCVDTNSSPQQLFHHSSIHDFSLSEGCLLYKSCARKLTAVCEEHVMDTPCSYWSVNDYLTWRFVEVIYVCGLMGRHSIISTSSLQTCFVIAFVWWTAQWYTCWCTLWRLPSAPPGRYFCSDWMVPVVWSKSRSCARQQLFHAGFLVPSASFQRTWVGFHVSLVIRMSLLKSTGNIATLAWCWCRTLSSHTCVRVQFLRCWSFRVQGSVFPNDHSLCIITRLAQRKSKTFVISVSWMFLPLLILVMSGFLCEYMKDTRKSGTQFRTVWKPSTTLIRQQCHPLQQPPQFRRHRNVPKCVVLEPERVEEITRKATNTDLSAGLEIFDISLSPCSCRQKLRSWQSVVRGVQRLPPVTRSHLSREWGRPLRCTSTPSAPMTHHGFLCAQVSSVAGIRPGTQ